MTRPRSRTRTAALTAALIAAASLVTVSTGAVEPASAACAPSAKVVKAKVKATKAHVKASKPAVRKVGKKYVATATLTATSGSASATVTQTICPNGASAAAVTTTQAATIKGTATKAVKKKAATRKKVVKALKAAEKKAKKSLAARAKKKGKKLSKAGAIAVARAKTHHVLYDSSVFYLRESGSTVAISTTPPAGSSTLRRGANGDLVLTYRGTPSETSLPCLTRAKAWPSAFLFDGGAATAPAWLAAAKADGESHAITAFPVAGLPDSLTGGDEWVNSWYWAGTTPEHGGGVATSSSASPPTPFAGTAVCFLAEDEPVPAGVVTLHGAHVGTSLQATSTSNLWNIAGGVPVSLG